MNDNQDSNGNLDSHRKLTSPSQLNTPESLPINKRKKWISMNENQRNQSPNSATILKYLQTSQMVSPTNEDEFVFIPTEIDEGDVSKRDVVYSPQKIFKLDTQEADEFLEKDLRHKEIFFRCDSKDFENNNILSFPTETDTLRRGGDTARATSLYDHMLTQVTQPDQDVFHTQPIEEIKEDTESEIQFPEVTLTKSASVAPKSSFKQNFAAKFKKNLTVIDHKFPNIASLPTSAFRRDSVQTVHTPMTGSSQIESKWAKARTPFTALKFSTGADQAIERRISNIMRGMKATAMANSGPTRRFYINPKSIKKMIWDTVIFVTTIYYAFAAPYRWSQRVDVKYWLAVDIPLDILTLVDILLMFVTGILSSDHTVIKDYKLIAKKYIRTYFFIDLIAMLPFYAISRNWYLLKFLRTFQLRRVSRLTRQVFMQSFRRGLDFFLFLRDMFIFVIFIHLLVSVWIFLGEDPSYTTTWLGDSRGIGLHDKNFLVTLYIKALSFVTSTISSTGMDVVAATNTTEQVVSMLYMFVGTIVIALLQGQIIYMISTKANVNNRIQSEEVELEKWLALRELLKLKILNNDGGMIENPHLHHVMQDIRQYFRADRVFSYKKLTSNVEFFNVISPSMQDKIIQTCFNKFVKKFRIFFDTIKDASFTRELISSLGLKIYSDTQKVIKQGAQSAGLHFILRGKVIVAYKKLPILTLGEGSFFGESLLLDRNLNIEYIANHYGGHEFKCLYVPRKTFLEICYRYPKVMHSLKKLAYMREDHFESVSLRRYELMKKTIKVKMIQGFTHCFTTKSSKNIETVKNITSQGEEIPPLPLKREVSIVIQEEEDLVNAAEMIRDKIDLKSMLEDAENFEQEEENGESHQFPSVTTVISPNIVPVFESITENILVEKLAKEDILSFESSDEENSSDSSPAETPTPGKASRRRFTEHYEKQIARRSTTRKIHIDKQPSAIVPSLVTESEKGGYKLNHQVNEERESQNQGLSDDEEDEDSESDGSNEDDSDLDRSMEVPLEMFEPTYEDTDEANMILKSLKARIDINLHKLERLKRAFREKILEEWKNVRKVKTFRLNSITELTPAHSAYSGGTIHYTGFTDFNLNNDSRNVITTISE